LRGTVNTPQKCIELWRYNALPFVFAVSFKSKLKNWRYFGVRLLGIGWDIKGLDEQNKVLAINTSVLFCM